MTLARRQKLTTRMQVWALVPVTGPCSHQYEVPIGTGPGESPSGCPRRMVGSTGAVPTWIGNTSVCDDLHQQDSEGPHVSLDGEHPKVDGLWGSPLDGELSPCQGGAGAPGTANLPPSARSSPSPFLPVLPGGLAGCGHKDIGWHSDLLLS